MHATTENQISLTDVARQERVSTGTVWRWAGPGVRGGVRLRTVAVGGRRYTTATWLADFKARCTARANGETVDEITPSAVARAEERQLAAAEEACEAAGI